MTADEAAFSIEVALLAPALGESMFVPRFGAFNYGFSVIVSIFNAKVDVSDTRALHRGPGIEAISGRAFQNWSDNHIRTPLTTMDYCFRRGGEGHYPHPIRRKTGTIPLVRRAKDRADNRSALVQLRQSAFMSLSEVMEDLVRFTFGSIFLSCVSQMVRGKICASRQR